MGGCGWPEACHGGDTGTPRPCGRALVARRRRVRAARTRCPETVRPAGHPDRLTSRRSQLGCFLFFMRPSGSHTRRRNDARILRAHAERVGRPRDGDRVSVARRVRPGGPGSPTGPHSRSAGADAGARGWPRESGGCGWPKACHGGDTGTPRPVPLISSADQCGVAGAEPAASCSRGRVTTSENPSPARRRRVLRLTSGVRGRSDPPAILAGSRPDARGWVVSCLHAARPGRIQDGAGDARILRARLGRADACADDPNPDVLTPAGPRRRGRRPP
jgi:hypothetical protein